MHERAHYCMSVHERACVSPGVLGSLCSRKQGNPANLSGVSVTDSRQSARALTGVHYLKGKGHLCLPLHQK